MTPANRFSFPDDSRILDACDSLKIHLYKDDEGEVTAFFEISGSVGPVDDDDGPMVAKPDIRLVRELLQRFERVRD